MAETIASSPVIGQAFPFPTSPSFPSGRDVKQDGGPNAAAAGQSGLGRGISNSRSMNPQQRSEHVVKRNYVGGEKGGGIYYTH